MISTRSRLRRTVAAVSATLIAAGGLSLAGAPADASTSGGVTIPAFYDPPRTLPSANGAIVRSEPLKLGVTLDVPGSTGPLPGKATLLMYKSTDTSGRPVAVTGTYIEPTEKWTGSGARPLVSLAAGTQGQGDQCAPSLGFKNPVTVTPNTLAAGYEAIAAYQLLSKGVAVVVTDYVGLGTTDRLHTYVNRLDQGRAVLDAARAARNLPGTSLTGASKVGLYGYSQGGGAAASAAELAAGYAPELPIAGTYAGAPPADLAATLAQVDGTVLTSVIGFAVNGFVQTYPELRTALAANTNAAGRAALDDISDACIGDGALKYAFKSTKEWTTSGKTLSAVIDGIPAAKAVLAAQKLGTLKPTGPVRVATGTQDDIVPHAQAKRLAADYCAKGASVSYAPLIQPLATNGTALNHIGPLLLDQGDAQQWMIDRFNAKPVISNCFALPLLP